MFQERGPSNTEGAGEIYAVTWKGLEAVTLSAGIGASRSCPKGFFAILHGRHVWKPLLIACRVLRNQKSSRSSDSTMRTPLCGRMCVCIINRPVKCNDPWRIGCICIDRLANWSRPPMRNNQSSKKTEACSHYSGGRGQPSRNARSSDPKQSFCTYLIQYVHTSANSEASSSPGGFLLYLVFCTKERRP